MSKYASGSTNKKQKVRLVLIIERGVKCALLQQSIKKTCISRPDVGSMNEIACQYIFDGLRRAKVNVDEIIKSGHRAAKKLQKKEAFVHV